jgi:hypothetical protein
MRRNLWSVIRPIRVKLHCMVGYLLFTRSLEPVLPSIEDVARQALI